MVTWVTMWKEEKPIEVESEIALLFVLLNECLEWEKEEGKEINFISVQLNW